MNTPLQLPLPIALHQDLSFANFYPGKNQFILDSLKKIALGKGEFFIYLWGQPGLGRSHLLQASCQTATENNLTAFYLPLAQLDQLSIKLIENLEIFNLICIDDLQLIAGNKLWEEAIFHLYNRSQRPKTRLIISANKPPAELSLTLPDLTSRLLSGTILHLQELEDAEKLSLLQTNAHSRGLELPFEVAQYLLNHHPRNLNLLFNALNQLDQASLINQRKLTIPFLKKILFI